MPTPGKLVVIGGDAAGMSAVSAAKKPQGDSLEVTVLERGRWTSYSACGIPYWVSGDVATAEDLVARTPQEHRARGIDVRTGTEAVGIDLDAGRVEVRGPRGGQSSIGYDSLMVATGATPRFPDLPGVGAEGISGSRPSNRARRSSATSKRASRAGRWWSAAAYRRRDGRGLCPTWPAGDARRPGA